MVELAAVILAVAVGLIISRVPDRPLQFRFMAWLVAWLVFGPQPESSADDVVQLLAGMILAEWCYHRVRRRG